MKEHFIDCLDLIKAGLHRHEDCCGKCHCLGMTVFSPKIPLRYRDVAFYCCCGAVGVELDGPTIERILQSKKGEDE